MNRCDDRDNRARILPTVGLACLVVAIGSKSLDLQFGLKPIPLHFLQGALAGFGVAVVLHAWRKTRRRR